MTRPSRSKGSARSARRQARFVTRSIDASTCASSLPSRRSAAMARGAVPEVDLEGIAFADDYLWIAGSHSAARARTRGTIRVRRDRRTCRRRTIREPFPACVHSRQAGRGWTGARASMADCRRTRAAGRAAARRTEERCPHARALRRSASRSVPLDSEQGQRLRHRRDRGGAGRAVVPWAARTCARWMGMRAGDHGRRPSRSRTAN